jgi:hypothetical protein
MIPCRRGPLLFLPAIAQQVSGAVGKHSENRMKEQEELRYILICEIIIAWDIK